MLKPQENFFQLYPISSNKSRAKGSALESPIGKRKIRPAQASGPASNSWAWPDEEQIHLLEKRAAELNDTLRSVSDGRRSDKPLPSLPEAPPPLYIPRLTPDGRNTNKLIAPFSKKFPSLTLIVKLTKHSRANMTVSPNMGGTHFDIKKRDTDSVANTLSWSAEERDSFPGHDVNAAPVYAAKKSGKSDFKIVAQPDFAQKDKVEQYPGTNSPKDQSHTQLPVLNLLSNLPSKSRPREILHSSASFMGLMNQLTEKANPTNRYLLEDRLAALSLLERHRNKRGILKAAGVRKARRTSILGESRRVHFATNQRQRPLNENDVVENENCMNNQPCGNEEKTALPSINPHMKGSQKATVFSESGHSEANKISRDDVHTHSPSSSPIPDLLHPQQPRESELLDHFQQSFAILPMEEKSKAGTSPQILPPSPEGWWSTEPLGNSFTSSEVSPSLIVAPLFGGHNGINAVPAPPISSHPGYQQMKSMPADLAQMEMHIHHYMDSGFNSMTKSFTDKNDRILDQLVGRLELIEEKAEKGTKALERIMTDVKDEFAGFRQDNKAIWEEVCWMKNFVQGVDLKLELMSGSTETRRYNEWCRQGAPSSRGSQDSDRRQAMPNPFQNLTTQGSFKRDQDRRAQTSINQGHQPNQPTSSTHNSSESRNSDYRQVVSKQSQDLSIQDSFGSSSQKTSVSSSQGHLPRQFLPDPSKSSEIREPDCRQTMPQHSQVLAAEESSGNSQQRHAQSHAPSSHGHHSNPSFTGRDGVSKKGIFARTENTNRQAPDLKDHPAFAGGQIDHPLTFSGASSQESKSGFITTPPLFQTPSFRDGGWYRQAYGL